MFHPTLKSLPSEDICILVKAENHAWNYICECGDASLLGVKECQDTAAVFISHTHIDHFVNFDTILRHQIGIERTVVIVGPAGIAEQVQAKIKSYTWNLIQKGSIVYEIHEITDENEFSVFGIEPPLWNLDFVRKESGKPVFENELFDVSYTLLDHKIPTVAYLFRERNTVSIDIAKSKMKGGKWVKELKAAFEQNLPQAEIEVDGNKVAAQTLFDLLTVKQGDTFGVVMDHAASVENHRKIIETFAGVNTVFVEAFYKEEDKVQAEKNFHSYSAQSAKVMKAAGVKNPVPVHFSRKYDEGEIELLIREFKTELEK